MPVYNREEFVAEAIESILQQTMSDFELLIVDDASTDGSLAIIQDYAERDARIRLLKHLENRGNGAARNTAIIHATGKFVAQMDSDDVSLPQRLEKQAAYLEAHPRIGGVSVHYRVCTEDMSPISSLQLPVHHHSIILRYVLYIGPAMKCAPLMVRQECLDLEPVYDPNYVIGSDADHLLRLVSEKNTRLANIGEVLYLYRRHENSWSALHQATGMQTYIQIRSRALRRLGAPGISAAWILKRHPLKKLSWNERRRARRDLTSLIGAMVKHNWVDAEDEPLLYDEVNQLLESTTPRHWQMFLQWYRYRIARHLK